jgi:leucine dehydrogenase
MTLRYERRDYRELPDYDSHAIHCLVDGQKLVAATCVHREGLGVPTHIGPLATSGGGVRWRADCNTLSEFQIVSDGLRLSKGMSEKSAAIGETVGGAKTVVRWAGDRAVLWEAFAKELLPHVPGYIIAEDSGTSAQDMALIKKYAPQALVAGLTSASDPSPVTASGVIRGIEVVLQSIGISPPPSLQGRSYIGECSYAVKGVGAVGGAIVDKLVELGVRDIRIADPNTKRLEEVRRDRKGIKIVSLETIHTEFVDVFVPCALGGSLSKKTIPDMACLAVAGCENNQLAEADDGRILYEMGIQYAPDFVINGGGLISVFSEIIKDRTVAGMIPRIDNNLRDIFDKSKTQHRAPSVIARELALKRMANTMFLPK